MTETLFIDFTGVEEKPENQYPERIKPGVYDFKISGMEFKTAENEKKTPYVEITFNTGNLQHTDKFYLTHKALPRLKHLLTQAGVDKDILSKDVTSDGLKKASMGKSFRGLLGGRQYLNNENKLRVAPEFPFQNFAEPLGGSTLVFDETKHIRLLDIPTVIESSAGTALVMPSVGQAKDSSDDLPF